MDFTNSRIKTEFLCGMLNLALDSMIENEICCNCRNNLEKSHYICSDIDLCRAYLFEGMADEIRKRGEFKCT